MSRAAGELGLVLHTHLPHLAGHGIWPVGEEWLFQAWATSWLPVTRALERLAEDGHRDVLTLGVTPTVAHQVADPRLAGDLATWLGGQVWRSEEQRWHTAMGPEVQALSSFYWQRFTSLGDYHAGVQRRGGLLTVWADLAARGVVELLGGPATHPYLPLQPDPTLIDAQLAAGLEHHAAWAGARPSGLWPPELGYRPRGRVADATAAPEAVDQHGTPTLPRLDAAVPGLEAHYAAQGIDHVLVDAPTLIRAAGGPERDWTARPQPPPPGVEQPDAVVRDGVWIGDADVAAFARDLAVTYHVWSPSGGYPGAAWYRDYFASGGYGVHPSWRVTDRTLPPDAKAPYAPDAAQRQVERDVDHLHGVLREVLDPCPSGLVVAAHDTELFGHWWFEGVDFLERLVRTVAADTTLRTTTLRSRLDRHPPTRRLHLPESSWGFAQGHASWVNDLTRPMWRTLRDAEGRARQALAGGRGGRALRAQAARELAQLAASDWPFMAVRGANPDYARDRVDGHARALHAVCGLLERDVGDAEPEAVALLAQLAHDDGPAHPSALTAALDPDGPEASARRPPAPAYTSR